MDISAYRIDEKSGKMDCLTIEYDPEKEADCREVSSRLSIYTPLFYKKEEVELGINVMEIIGKILNVISKYNKSKHGALETYSQYDALRDIAAIIGVEIE